MKDSQRLVEKITRLRVPGRDPDRAGRDISPAQGQDPLASFLTEIDETLLPRALTFRTDTSVLTVSAGNRRMISLDAAGGAASAAAEPILGKSMTRPDVADLGRLRDALVAAFAGSSAIFVKSDAPNSTETELAAGTTAVALASAWGVDLSAWPDSGWGGEDVAPIEDFLATVPRFSKAWLRIADGGVTEMGGDEGLLARLRDFADSADMAELDMEPNPEARRFISIGRAPSDGDCLLFVSDEMDAALVMVAAAELDEAKEAWRASIG